MVLWVNPELLKSTYHADAALSDDRRQFQTFFDKCEPFGEMNNILAKFAFYLFVPGGIAAFSLKPWRSALSLLSIFALILVFIASRAVASFVGLALLGLSILAVHLLDVFYAIQEPTRRTKPNIFTLALSVTITIGIVISALYYRAQILGIDLYYIPSNSMVPTLLPGDIVLANTWISDEEIYPGDIIVFEHPDAKGFLLIKRVISKDSQSLIVAGDNRTNSLDSRTLGRIALPLVKAKATDILRSFSVHKLTQRIPDGS